MQLATAIEPLAKFQPLSKIARSEMLHSLLVVWIHALCMQCSPHSRAGNTKTPGNSSRTPTWTALYHLNNAFFFIYAFINPLNAELNLICHLLALLGGATIVVVSRLRVNITLGCKADAGKCTGISQYLVNSSKHSSGWYSTVRKTSLIFSYGMN